MTLGELLYRIDGEVPDGVLATDSVMVVRFVDEDGRSLEFVGVDGGDGLGLSLTITLRAENADSPLPIPVGADYNVDAHNIEIEVL